MTAIELNGKELAQQLRMKMKDEVTQLKNEDIFPQLTVILVGDDPASKSYVNGKKKASAEVGIESKIINLPTEITEKALLKEIDKLNNDSSVHGILVQLPLPDHIQDQNIIEAIRPDKDVDGFHPINIGKMMTNQDTFLPCTPYGIMTMLKSKSIQIEGQNAIVVGRSNIVGKPIGQMLLNENATVTYCHSKTKNLKAYTQKADILIVATGRPHAIDASYVKDNAVIIDVGINRLADGSLTGDVNFEDVKEKASYITPVPRGVGPMTIAMLLTNTIKAAKELSIREA